MAPARRTAETTDALRAALVGHARRLVEREGAAALTMRALAAEAGCAVGLPYKVFADRRELVDELLRHEFVRLRAAFDELVDRAGTGAVGGNLAWFAEVLLDSPAVGLADEVVPHVAAHEFHATGIAGGFETTIPAYLAAEKRAGRVAPDVDEEAFGFLVAGAVHNLLVSGDAYPKPDRRRLRRLLAAVARQLAPASTRTSPRDPSPEEPEGDHAPHH